MDGTHGASVEKKDEVIEIPIGKYGRKLRENPWIISTFVLGLALVVVLIYSSVSGGVTGKTIGADAAASKVSDFIVSNPQFTGTLDLVSVEQKGSLYEAIFNYQGQEVPVYVTLDGQFLATGLVPLDDALGFDGGIEGAVDVSEDDDAVLGSANAPVTIIEFSDYQCPFCQRFWADTYPLIKKNYIDTGKAKLVYRDFPLTAIHPMAMDAAIAAECVREKGGDEAYFEYHDELFANQPSLSYENLKKWASELGYDISSCLDNEEFLDEVLADLDSGSAAGVTGTPGFFINGRLIEGAQPYSVFEQLIESELAAVGA